MKKLTFARKPRTVTQFKKLLGQLGPMILQNAITSVPVGQANEDFFLKPFQDDPEITSLGFEVKVSKKMNKLYFNSQLDKIISKGPGCGWTYVGGAEITSKDLNPIEIKAAIEQCYNVFVDTYFSEGLPTGAARGELSPEIQDILLNLFNNAFKRDVLTLLFLGDTGLSSPYYKMMDGMYAVLQNDADTVNVGAISDSALEPANIEATMYSIYNAQPRLMRGLPNAAKKFIVTGTVYDAWLRYVQLKTGTNVIIQRESITNGVEGSNYYQGSEIVPIRIVDERLNSDFMTGSPSAPENPNRIIYTLPSNHVLQLDKASFGDARAWYSQDDDKFRIAGSAILAYQFKYSELQVIAGF